jgi:hypothetical protein
MNKKLNRFTRTQCRKPFDKTSSSQRCERIIRNVGRKLQGNCSALPNLKLAKNGFSQANKHLLPDYKVGWLAIWLVVWFVSSFLTFMYIRLPDVTICLPGSIYTLLLAGRIPSSFSFSGCRQGNFF